MNPIRFICSVENTDGTMSYICCNKMLSSSANERDYLSLSDEDFMAYLLAEEVENEIYIYPTVVRGGFQDRIIKSTNSPELVELKNKFKKTLGD